MAITYNAGTNIITVTGYTEATPCNFTDIYNADKAGTLSLHDRDGISAVDGAAVAVTRGLRPADYVILGGSSGDLYVVVTNWTNMTTATIRITGTDRDGNSQTEDIVINANGTFNTTKWFKTVTHTQVTVFTKTDSGSFDYELIQGQWGVIWRTGDTQFRFDAGFYLGDGTTTTWLTDLDKEVIFTARFKIGKGYYCIYVKELAFLQFGSTVHLSRGCSLKTEFLGHTSFIKAPFRSVFLYGCWFSGNDSMLISIPAGSIVSNCVLSRNFQFFGSNCNINNTVILSATKGFADSAIVGDNLIVGNVDRAFTTGDGLAFTVKNIKVFNAITDFELYALLSEHCYAINIECGWNFYWGGTSTHGLYRQYEFNLKVQGKDENIISGAAVKIWDKDDNLVVDTTTGAGGAIAMQTLNYGYYNQAGGNNPTMQTPHTIQISKAGYETYKKKWAIDKKTDWIIALPTPKRRFDSLEG